MAMSTPASTAPLADSLSLNDPSLYLDREISLLAFQHRVLEEAKDSATPLLERVKFLSILFSNIDEFFMVRFAVLKQKAATGQDGSLAEQMDRIRATVQRLMADAYDAWREIEAALTQSGIELRDYRALTHRERSLMETYFRQVVY